MMSKEAMKLALEALEPLVRRAAPWGELDWLNGCKAITALREALAEPQEKYQYGTPLLDAMRGKANEALDKKAENARELGLDYEPAQQEPTSLFETFDQFGEGWERLAWELCAEEHGEDACSELIWEGGPIPEPWGDRWLKYEDEAKRLIGLVRKCTAPQPPAQQEPVVRWDSDGWGDLLVDGLPDGTLLYTSPPAQRTWVGLTDEERMECFNSAEWNDLMQYAEVIEAKLREKNA